MQQIEQGTLNCKNFLPSSAESKKQKVIKGNLWITSKQVKQIARFLQQ